MVTHPKTLLGTVGGTSSAGGAPRIDDGAPGVGVGAGRGARAATSGERGGVPPVGGAPRIDDVSSTTSGGTAQDMHEAWLDRQDQVAEELREMEIGDEARAHELHVEGDCAFCAMYDSGDGQGLDRWLAHMCEAYYHSFSRVSLGVVSKSAALLDQEGRRALGMFALVGDAALTLAVVDKCHHLRFQKGRANEARVKCTNWATLARLFARKVPTGLVSFPADVDPGTTRAGGEAFEALLGLVFEELAEAHVLSFARNIGVYEAYDFGV